MKNTMAKVELISASAIFGTIGIFRKAIPMNSGMLSMLRGFLGMLTILIFVLCKKQKINFKAIKQNLGLLVLSGAGIGINWVLLFEAYSYTSVAVSTLCYYMSPVFVVIASSFILKENLKPSHIICTLVAVLGMVFVSNFWNANNNQNQIIGILLSLGAALLYATDIICNKKMSNISAEDRTIVQLFISGLVVVPYALFVEEPALFEPTFKIVMFVLILGILHTGISYLMMFDSIAKLDTKTVAFFTYLDPVLSVILSALLLKEQINIFTIIGAVCILGSALYNELKSN